MSRSGSGVTQSSVVANPTVTTLPLIATNIISPVPLSILMGKLIAQTSDNLKFDNTPFDSLPEEDADKMIAGLREGGLHMFQHNNYAGAILLFDPIYQYCKSRNKVKWERGAFNLGRALFKEAKNSLSELIKARFYLQEAVNIVSNTADEKTIQEYKKQLEECDTAINNLQKNNSIAAGSASIASPIESKASVPENISPAVGTPATAAVAANTITSSLSSVDLQPTRAVTTSNNNVTPPPAKAVAKVQPDPVKESQLKGFFNRKPVTKAVVTGENRLVM